MAFLGIWTELVNSKRIIIFSSKIVYRDLPELSPTQVRRLKKIAPKSNRIEFGSLHEWSGVWNRPNLNTQ